MIGPRWWATGVTCKWRPTATNGGPGWSGTLQFYDSGFCDDDTDAGQVSTEGELRSRYYVPDGTTTDGLTAMLDVLIADAARLGIVFDHHGTAPYLYVEGDGERDDVPLPDGWREMLAVQALRLGWETYRLERVAAVRLDPAGARELPGGGA